MENREIASVFERMAEMLQFLGANPFRVRAYENGARRIGDLSQSIADMVSREEDLTQLDGIGTDLASKIRTLVTTGGLPQLDELEAQVPPEVLMLLRVPGLGPKKAAVLHRELGIGSLDALRAACEAQQVRKLKGFGAKTEETILAGIDLAEHIGQRVEWALADQLVESLLEYMRPCEEVLQISPAGSYRRGCETVGDLDLLVDATDPAAVMDRLAAFPGVADILARGDTKLSVRLDSGMQVDLRVVPTESYGAALQYFTGSKDHNVVLRGRAKDRGIKVNEWGVFRLSKSGKEEYLAGKTEAEVYAALDLPHFPPEMRENRGELEFGMDDPLPKLVELADLKGDLHMHTSATDGKQTIREMADAARERNLHYIAITDHSKRVTMARGLTAERLRAQWQEVDKANSEYDDLTILKGIECDILESGGMDLPDDLLAEGDWVIASVHYGQNQSKQQITDRIIGALKNPWVSVVAHPTGRLINRRDPYAVDMEAVLQAAKEYGKALELNANPARLDLNDVYCARARELGIPIVICSDAHSIGGLDVLRYGIVQARRGWLTAEDVGNAQPWEVLRKQIRRGS